MASQTLSIPRTSMQIFHARFINQEYPEDSSDLGLYSSVELAKAAVQAEADEYRGEDELEPEAVEWEARGSVLIGFVTMPGHMSDDSWFEITTRKLDEEPDSDEL